MTSISVVQKHNYPADKNLLVLMRVFMSLRNKVR
jgi:hypothetical protein